MDTASLPAAHATQERPPPPCRDTYWDTGRSYDVGLEPELEGLRRPLLEIQDAWVRFQVGEPFRKYLNDTDAPIQSQSVVYAVVQIPDAFGAGNTEPRRLDALDVIADTAAPWLRDDPDRYLLIRDHSSGSNTDDSAAISRHRSEAARSALMHRGLESKQLRVVAAGSAAFEHDPGSCKRERLEVMYICCKFPPVIIRRDRANGRGTAEKGELGD